MARPLVLAGLLAMVLEMGSPAQQPVFRTGTDVVGFGVTVTDRRGNFITDLKPDDLEILEEGVPQGIQLFTRGDETETGAEMHIGLVFDTSGSMGDDITLARSAAVRFLNTLTDAKDMTLVDFDTEVRVAKYGQLEFPRLGLVRLDEMDAALAELRATMEPSTFSRRTPSDHAAA